MATQGSVSGTKAGAAVSRNWLGERDPSHSDVVSANERPDAVSLSTFKRSLAANHDAASLEALLHFSLSSWYPTSTNIHTYPLAVLRDYPALPTQDCLQGLSREFNEHCRRHIFFERFPVAALERETAMPLSLGMACFASVCQRNDSEQAETLFLAGANMWLVIIESDNRLARSVEMVYAAALLIPFGLLAPSKAYRVKATLLLSGSLTIARRLKLQSPEQLDDTLSQRASIHSPLLWSLWLWDVVNALHCDGILQFSSGEILSAISPSTKPFQEAYAELMEELDGTFACTPTSAMSIASRELAVLLLLAILSDTITLYRSLKSCAKDISVPKTRSHQQNPFVPFTAHAELERMQVRLDVALNRWHSIYLPHLDPETLALYQYCRLLLSFPSLLSLGRIASDRIAYPAQLPSTVTMENTLISDFSIKTAWSILDSAAGMPRKSTNLCVIWMPIVIFHAAIIIWARVYVSHYSDDSGGAVGSARTLIAFKGELETMNWPCCAYMASFLDQLISIETASQRQGLDSVYP